MTGTPGGKYGDELPELKPGEPFFVLRAQDALAPYALETYSSLLRAAAAGLHDAGKVIDTYGQDEGLTQRALRLAAMADDVHRRAAQMLAWQAANDVKLPD